MTSLSTRLPSTRFNGATAFRQWKQVGPGQCGYFFWLASMGPPPFGSGNYPHRPDPRGHSSASMGPPPFGSGNEPKMGERLVSLAKLQWGHRLSAVETLVIATASDDLLSRLQWGHRLSAVETPSRPTSKMTGRNPLQWGHRLSAVETSSILAPCSSSLVLLQWGHRLSAVETSLAQGAVLPWQSRFNGATAFRQWKRGQRQPAPAA